MIIACADIKKSPMSLQNHSQIIFHRFLRIGRKHLLDQFIRKGYNFFSSGDHPVSMTCITCKVLKNIVVTQVMTHANKHNILFNLQHSFHEKDSLQKITTVNRIILLSWILQRLSIMCATSYHSMVFRAYVTFDLET